MADDRIAAGAHGDEAGQVLVLGPQAVGDPGPHAGPRQPAVAAVHQHQRRLVVGHVGVHRADDAHVVDVRAVLANSSLTSMPLWPYFWNLNGDRIAAPVLRSVRRFGFGSGLPWYLSSSGLGSNVSTCDGPPFMNKWTTRLAFGLLRNRRRHALGAGGVGVGKIERAKQARQIQPIDESVQRSPRGSRLRQAFDRRAAEGRLQPTDHCQQGVSHRFEIESAAIHLPQPGVFGIDALAIGPIVTQPVDMPRITIVRCL